MGKRSFPSRLPPGEFFHRSQSSRRAGEVSRPPPCLRFPGREELLGGQRQLGASRRAAPRRAHGTAGAPVQSDPTGGAGSRGEPGELGGAGGAAGPGRGGSEQSAAEGALPRRERRGAARSGGGVTGAPGPPSPHTHTQARTDTQTYRHTAPHTHTETRRRPLVRGERMRRVRPWALVLGGLLCACARVCAGAGAGSYPHSAVLDGAGAYRLRWGRRGSALALRLEVRTRGYVGFGLSASGGMASADIVVGGVERGQPYLQVRTCSFPSTADPRPLCPPAFPPLSLSRDSFSFPAPRFFCSPPALHPCTSSLLPSTVRVIPVLLRFFPLEERLHFDLLPANLPSKLLHEFR